MYRCTAGVRMTTVTLRCVEDNASGDIGLVVSNLRQMSEEFMASTDGALIAHDILEHQNGIASIGSIDDELEALGGVWYVRGQHGTLRPNSYHSPEVSLGGDVMNLGMYFVEREIEFRKPVPNTRPHLHDESFKEIIKGGIRSLKCELEVDSEWQEQRIKQYKKACLHYMRAGYNKAHRRYRNENKANSMFWHIAAAVDTISAHLEYPGQEFLLRYSQYESTCREVEPDYYY